MVPSTVFLFIYTVFLSIYTWDRCPLYSVDTTVAAIPTLAHTVCVCSVQALRACAIWVVEISNYFSKLSPGTPLHDSHFIPAPSPSLLHPLELPPT